MTNTKTVKTTREEFISRFGKPAFDAMVTIAKQQSGRKIPKRVDTVTPRSLAAYKANLTRGAYKGFVTVSKNGTFNDRMDLINWR